MLSNLDRPYEFYDDGSAFEERAPWWGSDLQTLRNRIVRDPRSLTGHSRAMRFPVSDGSSDQLTGTLETPLSTPTGPLIIIIHGLTGCEDSQYVRETASFHLSNARRVLRLNLRGAGSSRMTCRGYYHAGCAADLQDVIAGLDRSIAPEGIFPIGYSLGGNMLINLLDAYSGPHDLVGAATVSAPIRPMQAARRLMAPRNVFYHYWFLRQMKTESLVPEAQLSSKEIKAILAARSIYQFDNDFTAPRNGFCDVEDYYERTAGINFVKNLSIPVAMIHARNDPWIPVTPYLELRKDCPPNVRVIITNGGGHVGFHAKGSKIAWHDRYIAKFLDAILQIDRR